MLHQLCCIIFWFAGSIEKCSLLTLWFFYAVDAMKFARGENFTDKKLAWVVLFNSSNSITQDGAVHLPIRHRFATSILKVPDQQFT